MVIYEKIKSCFFRNWFLRDRGRYFVFLSVYFFLFFVIIVVNRSSVVVWLLMFEYLIWWFLIFFSGEFVVDMVFGKKSKIFKICFGIFVVSGILLLFSVLLAYLFFVWFGFINWWVVFFIEVGVDLLVGCVI